MSTEGAGEGLERKRLRCWCRLAPKEDYGQVPMLRKMHFEDNGALYSMLSPTVFCNK